MRGLFRNPSAYIGDPAGHVVNQIGHVLLGVVGVWVASQWLPAFYIIVWAWVLVGVYGILWEAAQVYFYKAPAWDGLEDTAFVSTGILAFAHGQWWPVAPMIFMLASGIFRRTAER